MSARLAVAGGALAAAVYVAALTPWAPWGPSEDLDVSFAYALHAHFLAGWPIGTRVIGTYGPFGFAFYNAYHPDTYGWLLAVRGGLAALTGALLAWLGAVASGRRWAVLALPAAGLPWCALVDAWGFLVAALALAVTWVDARAPGRAAAQYAAGVALGLFALIKVTFLVAALITIGAALLGAGARAAWRVPLATALTAMLGWYAAGQPAATVAPFLRWSLGDVSTGYARAMQMWPHHLLVVQAWGTAALLALSAGALAWPRRRPALAAALGIAALAALAFKAGFVRALDHVFIATAAFQLLGLVLAAFTWRRGRHALAAVLVLAPAALTLHATQHAVVATLLSPLRAAWDSAAGLTKLATRDNRAVFAAGNAAVRYRNPLPPLAGTVDIYPHDQGVLFAHGLSYAPRPVFQSYMAYTPALAEANRRSLAGPDAPRWLLFRIAPVDTRFPALDDGRAWPEILTRYRPVRREGKYLLLERRAAAAPWTLEPLGTRRARLGEWLAVPPPDGGPLWAQIDVREGLAQRAVAAAVQGALVVLEVETAVGEARRFRLVTPLARDGFLLSPLAETGLAFARLGGQMPDRTGLSAVRRMRVVIEPQRLTATFDPEIAVTLWRVHTEPWDVSAIDLASPEAAGLGTLLAHLIPPEPIGGAALIATDDGREAVNAHAPAHFRVPLAAGARAVQIEFGIRDHVVGCTNGIVLRLAGERDGILTPLYERTLTPRERRGDRGPQRARASWAPGAFSTLHIDVLDHGEIDCDWAYLAALEVAS